MAAMKTTIEALKQAGVRDKVKVLIGGAPITQKYAEEIGADGYSENAVGAGCEIPRDTPAANLRALCEYAHDHRP